MIKSNREMRQLVRRGYEIIDYAAAFAVDPLQLPPINAHFLAQLAQRLTPRARVIDLGCGVGIPADHFLADAGFDVTGIDFTPKHIAAARRNVPSATFIEADFTSVDLAPLRADAIICLYALFHIPRDEHAAVFAKVHGALPPGGLFLVTLGTSGSEYGQEQNWFGAPMAWSTFEPPDYEKMLADAGFEILESRFEGESGDDEYHFWVLAGRS